MRLPELRQMLLPLLTTLVVVASGAAYAVFMPGMGGDPVAATQAKAVLAAHYVGSQACQSCHQDQYARWSKTAMANIVQDPKLHPSAIIPDLAHADPMVKFSANDVAFTYGSIWKQRYFHKVGDDYFVYPVQWDIQNKKWLAYHVPDQNGDWWAKFYPDPASDNMGRPTGPLCDGCHSVNYNIETKQVSEWNVGCEMCHGAGSAHVANPTRSNILNPARQDYVHANDTCIQCHSQGQPLKNPVNGKYYDWAVGYHAGLNLKDFWKLEEHKLGEQNFFHFADGTAHKNRMQGNDFVQSLMYTRGVTCFSCHDPHGSPNQAMLRKPAAEVCNSCHVPGGTNGPQEASIEAHTHHPAGSVASQCISCHMPKVEAEIPGVNVAAHTFHFITPGDTDLLKVPNACNGCHKDKDTAWARTQLASWNSRSPWRVAQ